MKEIATLKDLMIFHLLSLYDTELQWTEALKEISGTIAAKDLKKIFQTSGKKAAAHAQKLNDILTQMQISTLSKKNVVAKDLVKEMNDLQNIAADPEVLHAGQIVIHQCMSHYMITKYGTVASFARLLQQEHIAGALHEIMEDEKETDEDLSRLAEEKINMKAKTALIV